MKMKKSALKKLKAALPKGSAEVLRKRLTIKGRPFTKQYIYRVLDPEHTDYNQFIIEEGILLVEEEKVQKKELHQRIHLLRKAI
jgi:hypothetical protein